MNGAEQKYLHKDSTCNVYVEECTVSALHLQPLMLKNQMKMKGKGPHETGVLCTFDFLVFTGSFGIGKPEDGNRKFLCSVRILPFDVSFCTL